MLITRRLLVAHYQLDMAVENLEQRDELADGLRVVGRIQKTIELRRRRPEPADDLALAQVAALNPAPQSGVPFEKRPGQYNRHSGGRAFQETLVAGHEQGARGPGQQIP